MFFCTKRNPSIVPARRKERVRLRPAFRCGSCPPSSSSSVQYTRAKSWHTTLEFHGCCSCHRTLSTHQSWTPLPPQSALPCEFDDSERGCDAKIHIFIGCNTKPRTFPNHARFQTWKRLVFRSSARRRGGLSRFRVACKTRRDCKSSKLVTKDEDRTSLPLTSSVCKDEVSRARSLPGPQSHRFKNLKVWLRAKESVKAGIQLQTIRCH